MLWLCLLSAPLLAQDHIYSDGFESRPDFPTSDGEAARFLTQASFGPTWAEIQSLRTQGYSAWLDAQMAAPASHIVPYLDFVAAIPEPVFQNARLEAWWLNAVTGPDQLRQRVAYALSQILVVSDLSAALDIQVYSVSHYYDLLIDRAFGNYRTLLGDMTRTPAMGTYLSMIANQAPDVALNIRPDENFAREMLQLFSIGLVMLNPDGTPVLVQGLPVPSYDQFHIKTFAHVYTGWHFAGCTDFLFCGPGAGDGIGWTQPMQTFNAFHHTEPDADPDNHQFLLGMQRPPGGGAASNLELALDNIFAHPNVGPFLARRLIQQLVTSNPSSAYVARVAAVFDDNGTGVRGDLGATVRAILLDGEAREGHLLQPTRFGKLREPLLRQTHLWRAFHAASADGRYRDHNPEANYGQAPNRSPSVFNFYLPDYQPPGELAAAELYAPELQIATETFVTRTANRLVGLSVFDHVGSPFQQNPPPDRVLIDFTDIQPLAVDPAALLDRLDVLLLNGLMSAQMRGVLLPYLSAIPFTAANDNGGRRRTWEAIHLIVTSAEYSVQR
ncbi:MAG: DUF1800 family protein [Xanthomonadales bacterium]|nr:DUF1800 family protein [Xanthomonadales bacterium]